jgi:hypothetical protein
MVAEGLYFNAPSSFYGTINSTTISSYANFSITPNAIGIYDLRGGIALQRKTQPYNNCWVMLTFLPTSLFPPTIVVENDPYVADVFPPYVWEVMPMQQNYKPGYSEYRCLHH